MTLPLKTMLPELTEGQIKLLERVILEGVIGVDQKSCHVKRWQCPNYEDCGEWAEYYKSSQTVYCSSDGRKMKLVEFDEEEGSDWDKNELRATQRLALRSLLYGGENHAQKTA